MLGLTAAGLSGLGTVVVAAEIAGTLEGDVLAIALTVPTFVVGLFGAMPQYVSLRALGSRSSVRSWVQRNRRLWLGGALAIALVSAVTSTAMISAGLLSVPGKARSRAIGYSLALSLMVYSAMLASVPIAWAISAGRARLVLYHQVVLGSGVLLGGLLLWVSRDMSAMPVIVARIVAAGAAAGALLCKFRSFNDLSARPGVRPKGRNTPSLVSQLLTAGRRRLFVAALGANAVSLTLPLIERAIVSGSELPLGSVSVLFFAQGLALSLGNGVGAGRTHRVSAILQAAVGSDELTRLTLTSARRTLLEMVAVVSIIEVLGGILWFSGAAETLLGQGLSKVLRVGAIYLISVPFVVSGTVLGRWFQLERRLAVAVGISALAGSTYVSYLFWTVQTGMQVEWVAAGYAGYWPLSWLLLYLFVVRSR